MFIGGFNKYAEACAAARNNGYEELSFQPALEDAGA